MKKYLILILLFGALSTGRANPIPIAEVIINELLIINENEWSLELAYDYVLDNISIDSIYLINQNEDTARLCNPEINENIGLLVLNNSDFNDAFHINLDGDGIILLAFMTIDNFNEVLTQELVFGNIEGSVISSPKQGQSLARMDGHYYKDASPTIGSVNDTEGMQGFLTGFIYDMNQAIVGNRSFRLMYPFSTDENGAYTTPILANSYSNSRLYYEDSQEFVYSEIVPIQVDMEPDSTIELDIHLLDSLVQSKKETLSEPGNYIKVYPNPGQAYSVMTVETKLPVHSSNIELLLTDMSGRLILKILMNSPTIQLETPGRQGIYILQISLNGKLIGSKKILLKND